MIYFLGIHWAQSVYVWMLAVAGVATVFLAVQLYKKNKLLALLAVPEQYRLMIPGYSWFKMCIKVACLSAGLFFVSVALLRPQWGKTETVVEQEGRELFIALDVSRSMLARDVKPDRLTFAKSKIKKLLQMLPTDRVGLVVFSGGAFVQCPLTADKSAFNLFLDTVDVETFSSGTTSIAQALRTVLDSFASLPTRKNKLVVMFTDGEDFSQGLADLKQEAQQAGLTIVTYGVGTTDGAPIPLVGQDGKVQGYQKDEQDRVVISKLNDTMLQSLALDSGGIAITATQSNQDMQQLIAQVMSHEKQKFEDKKIETEQDRYYLFTGAALLLLVLEWLL